MRRDVAAPIAPAPVEPLRVLLASYRSHPQVGGQGVYVREIARALAEIGHDVTVISGPPYPELPAGIPLVRLGSLDLFTYKNAFTAFRPRFLARRADLAEWWLHNTGAFGEPFAFGLRLERWMRDHAQAFDVVHDNQGLFSPLTRLGVPAVATLHHPITIDLEFALAAEQRFLYRLLLRRWHSFLSTQARTARALPALVTVSNASKQRAVADFGIDPQRISVSPNGVDHDVFFERTDAPRAPGLIVSTVSADTPMKGLVVLVRAMRQVVERHPSARLHIVGDLRDGPAKRAIDELSLQDNIVFGGRLSQPDLAALYARAAVVVSPSLFEGFGLPAAEAMACGAPVVVTDGGALPEVAGDAGLVAPAGDHEALGEAICALLADPERARALGVRAAERARERFSWRAHAVALTAAYLKAGARADR
ncbi:MAG: glycosyltransferase family 4 protein [Maricaulaceae bacterium]